LPWCARVPLERTPPASRGGHGWYVHLTARHVKFSIRCSQFQYVHCRTHRSCARRDGCTRLSACMFSGLETSTSSLWDLELLLGASQNCSIAREEQRVSLQFMTAVWSHGQVSCVPSACINLTTAALIKACTWCHALSMAMHRRLLWRHGQVSTYCSVQYAVRYRARSRFEVRSRCAPQFTGHVLRSAEQTVSCCLTNTCNPVACTSADVDCTAASILCRSHRHRTHAATSVPEKERRYLAIWFDTTSRQCALQAIVRIYEQRHQP